MYKFAFLILIVGCNSQVLQAQSGIVGDYRFLNGNTNANSGLSNQGHLEGNTGLKLPTCSSICAGTLGENIFPNGDFGSGVANILPTDPGLAPGYIYQFNPPPNDGYYSITNNTTPWGWFATNFWIDIEDNGPEPNGYMMVVNASYQPGLFYQRTVEVCENTPYEFSIDVISLIFSAYPGMIRPNISFLIDGVPVCETGDIAPDEQWHTSRFSFTTAPGQTMTTLALRNNAPGGGGNDLAIDNISFRTCGPLVTVPSEVSYCEGMPVTMHAVLATSTFANTVYQWQILNNGVWEDVPGADSTSLGIPNPVDGSMYRLLVASALSNLSRPNCRVASGTVHVKRLPDLVVNTAVQDVSCAGGSNGSASATTFSGMTPYKYAWDSGESTPDIDNLNAGTYWVTITDTLGCVGVGSITISEPTLLTTGIDATNITCFGGPGGDVVASANGGVAPYSYLWSNAETNASIANLMAGNYLVTVTDANACTVSASVTLTEPPQLTANATSTNVSCYGVNDAAATVTVSGGIAPFTYAWSNGENSNSLANLTAGTYLVVVTDMNACTTVATATVTAPPLLSTSTSSTNIACFGGTEGMALASVSGGVSPYSFLWSNGHTDAVVGNLSAGVYTYSATDAQGCVVTDTISIVQPPQLSVNTSGVELSCHGDAQGLANATATGGVGPYSFIWSNGQTNSSMTNLLAGNYLVTVSDANACTVSASVILTEPPLLTASATASDVSCFGMNDAAATVSVSGGMAPFAYVWSNGQNGALNQNLAAGTYLVVVTDVNACTTVATATVTAPPLLSTSTASTNVACFGGTDGTAIASVSGGVTPYTFLWSNGQTNAAVSNLPAGVYAYSATDARGCMVTDTTSIVQPPQLSVNTSAVEVSCHGNTDGLANATASGGVGPYAFLWSNGQNGALNQNLAAGTYTVTTTDQHGCQSVGPVTISQPSAIQLNVNPNPVSCHGAADGVITANLNGGTVPYTYQWSNGANGSSNFSLSAGIYSVTATDAHGCTMTAQAAVDQPTALASQVNANDVACNGHATAEISVAVTGGTSPYSYFWSTGANTSHIKNLPMGSYALSIIDAHGCSLMATAQINEPPPLLLQADKTNVRCFGDDDGTINAMPSGGTPPYMLQWSNGHTTAEIDGLKPGIYTLNVTDAKGCSVSTSEDLAEPAFLTIHLGLDLKLQLGDIVDLTAIVNLPSYEVMDYTWSGSGGSLQCTDCDNYRFQPTASGCQQVLVRSKKGCLAADTVCYQISPHRRVYAPNVFSPNGDGSNDFFTIFSDDGVRQIQSLKVFNRWGGHIYQANNIKTNDEPRGWDGTFKGKELNNDVFVWLALIEFIDGEVIQMSGDVTLVR